ncbi:MAG: alpha/beta hydrolase [Flavobacteriaceae bacterium]|nr:alpha/beta hydrolase [Flavobacteriaceae bacterium]
MPIWSIFLIVIGIIFATISTAMYFIQDTMIFHAEKLPANYQFSFNNNFEEFNLKTEDGEVLNGLLFKAESSKGVVIFYHNHSGNIEHWSRSATIFLKLNYDVLLNDYRGFGKSTGKYNEHFMLKDSMLWYNLMLKYYAKEKIVVFGRGIGATFATYVASINQVKLLILESPVYSLYQTAKAHYPYLPINLISKYRFETYKYINKVSCKIYIFHGKKNDLVPYNNSEKLHELVTDKSTLYLIDDGNHYNLVNNETYINKISKMLK